MKKIILAVLVTFALSASLSAQDKAIGLRLGGGSANGGEISFQKDLGTANRLELDLGFVGNSTYNGLSLTGVYQWLWDLKGLGEGFRWYAGIGAGLRAFNGLGLGLAGQLGIEYSFPSIPIQLSLDTRPGWYFGGVNGFDGGAALGVRYKF
ncbi:MAG TPA: hypothetical protein VFP20_00370 [Bacteroidales bacterium]|nr:hypothetical protein [Bacteroidales bacterium]